MTNPYKDGLPAIGKTYKSPDGIDVLMFGGIIRATNSAMRGDEIPANNYTTYRTLIARVDALRKALDARDERAGVKGGTDDPQNADG